MEILPTSLPPRLTQPIIQAVAEAFELHPDALLGRGQSFYLSSARFAAYWLLRYYAAERASYQEIARLFQRDHSGIVHGTQEADLRARTDATYALRIGAAIETIERAHFARPERTAA